MKVHIICRLNTSLYPGIWKKILHLSNAIKKRKNPVLITAIYSRSILKDSLSIARIILTSKSDLIIIRSQFYQIFFLIPLLCYRLKGGLVVTEVPTPIATGVKEVLLETHRNSYKKFLHIFFFYLSFPISLWVSNRVIQYAPDSLYFSFGSRKITYVTTNGVNVSEVAYRRLIPTFNNKTLVLLGVASVADWHGFDRVITGMAEYLSNPNFRHHNPIFLIVGDGGALQGLKELAEVLDLRSRVIFCGRIDGSDLDNIFEKAHVCVSSLASHRKGLRSHSCLKSRDYTARGFPFIRAGEDRDFECEPFFVLNVDENDDPVDMQRIYSWYEQLDLTVDKAISIRRYAENKLDFRHKVDAFIN